MCMPGDTVTGTPAPNRSTYEFRVEGRLDERAIDHVRDLTLALEIIPTGQGITTLTCVLANQQALVGLINRLHCLGLGLLRVERLEPRP